MPDPSLATPPLEPTELDELRKFLARMAVGGMSAVILTSRTEEVWLGRTLRRIPVDGLGADEANEYADNLLAGFTRATPRRAQRKFGELMEWLNGHPMSMRIVLPKLETTEPGALLAGLQGVSELPDNVGESGRTTSLAASITYSFEHLPAESRQLLVAVALFRDVVDVDVLAELSTQPSAQSQFSGTTHEMWEKALKEAASVGILTSLGAGMYRIHPALPGFLAGQWHRNSGGEYEQRRGAADAALLRAYAAFAVWLENEIRSGDAGLAYTIIGLQRRTMGDLLGRALSLKEWFLALCIARPLDDYWDVSGLYEEAKAWTDRARLVIEDEASGPPLLDSDAGALWIFLAGAQGNREEQLGRLDLSERTHLEIQQMLRQQPESPEQLSNFAVNYHHLGLVAQGRGRLDDAEGWYLKSLAISEELGDRPNMAGSYHHLGIVAHGRGRLDDAEGWYLKSLAISEKLGDRPGMGRSYHQLGIVAQGRGRLDDAEGWYLKSLAIFEALGDRPNMARSYHQFGNVAHGRGRLDDAEGWYLKSLAIKEDLGNLPGLALSYGQLGLLAEGRSQHYLALTWTVKSIALFSEFPHSATGPAPGHLARLTQQLGLAALEACWLEVTGSLLPTSVRQFVLRQGK